MIRELDTFAGSMGKAYVERQEGGYWIAGSRVSLDSVVAAFLGGASPEAVAAERFPTLTLEQVYRVITYYLAHRAEMDAYLRRADAEFEALRQRTREADPALIEKLLQACRQPSAPRL